MTSDITWNTSLPSKQQSMVIEVEVPDITIIVFHSSDRLEYLVLQKAFPQPEDAGRIFTTDIPEPGSFWRNLENILASSVRLGNLSENRLESMCWAFVKIRQKK